MRKKKIIDKKAKKLYDGECRICGESNYELLDVHRIVAGSTYEDKNTCVICSNCHRKCHAHLIQIDRQYLRSDGKWVLHYFDEKGVEHYK